MKINLAFAVIVMASSSLILCTAQRREVNNNRQVNATFTSAPAIANAEQEVAQMERDWSAAMTRQDIVTLEGLMADDVVINGPYGLKNKAKYLEEIKEEFKPIRKGDVVKIEEVIDDVKVKAYGDTLISYGRFHWKDENGGKTETGKSTFTDVSVKHNGRWQLSSCPP
jgi:ketosteroid isomerase-like protein